MYARALAQEDLNFDVKYGVNPARLHRKIANSIPDFCTHIHLPRFWQSNLKILPNNKVYFKSFQKRKSDNKIK